jgi:hypothetical protein
LSNGSEFSAPGGGTKSTAPVLPGNTPIGGSIPRGWHKPLPEHLPKPGYWPAIMAMGITFILWSLAVGFNEVVSTIIILFIVGLSLFTVALIGWIGDLRDERKDQNE